jgi:hypothetical protein
MPGNGIGEQKCHRNVTQESNHNPTLLGNDAESIYDNMTTKLTGNNTYLSAKMSNYEDNVYQGLK